MLGFQFPAGPSGLNRPLSWCCKSVCINLSSRCSMSSKRISVLLVSVETLRWFPLVISSVLDKQTWSVALNVDIILFFESFLFSWCSRWFYPNWAWPPFFHVLRVQMQIICGHLHVRLDTGPAGHSGNLPLAQTSDQRISLFSSINHTAPDNFYPIWSEN